MDSELNNQTKQRESISFDNDFFYVSESISLDTEGILFSRYRLFL